MMKWNGKSKGTKTGYAIFVYLLKIGLLPAYILLVFVTLYYLVAERRKIATRYRFYRQRIGYGVLRSIGSIYINYYIFGQCLIDRVAMRIASRRFTIDFVGEQHLTELAARKQGALLIGAHLGNWEIAGHFLYRINVPINIIMFDNEYEKIKEYMNAVDAGKNYKIIPIKDDLSHLYQITDALSRGEFVCLHADRCMDNSRLLNREFLGQTASFSESVFRLCVLFKTPVTFVSAFKTGYRRYRFYATVPKIYSGAKDEKLASFADDYVAELERRTKQYPHHWFNFYDFWN